MISDLIVNFHKILKNKNFKYIVIAVVLIIVLAILIKCAGNSDTELIAKMKETTYHYGLENTDYTWDEATKKVMKNVKWTEEDTDNYFKIIISGKEKSTGNEIEIVYAGYFSSGEMMLDTIQVNGNWSPDYWEKLFKPLMEE